MDQKEAYKNTVIEFKNHEPDGAVEYIVVISENPDKNALVRFREYDPGCRCVKNDLYFTVKGNCLRFLHACLKPLDHGQVTLAGPSIVIRGTNSTVIFVLYNEYDLDVSAWCEVDMDNEDFIKAINLIKDFLKREKELLEQENDFLEEM